MVSIRLTTLTVVALSLTGVNGAAKTTTATTPDAVAAKTTLSSSSAAVLPPIPPVPTTTTQAQTTPASVLTTPAGRKTRTTIASEPTLPAIPPVVIGTIGTVASSPVSAGVEPAAFPPYEDPGDWTKEGAEANYNLTPDGYWHNRYHALLAMSAYGSYNSLCPNQTFTAENEARNFPNSPFPPWNVINTFGPTPSGCSGFTAIVPEMNKAVIIFKGDYVLEQSLPADVVPWSAISPALGAACPTCTVNKFAAQGYAECKAETNNWEAIIGAYAGKKLVFSITGHGLGGMHSLIASVDLNNQLVDYYSHNYGTPRTFNQAGANWYNEQFNGEAGERGIANDDTYVEYFPASVNYSHAGTAFYYSGWNATGGGPNWEICWSGNNPYGPIEDDPFCDPRPVVGSTPEQDHYFYFANVGQCGGNPNQDTSVADAYIAFAKQSAVAAASSSSSLAAYSSSSAASYSSSLSAYSSSMSAASLASVHAASQTSTSAKSTGTSKGGGAASTNHDRSSWVAMAAVVVGVGAGLLIV